MMDREGLIYSQNLPLSSAHSPSVGQCVMPPWCIFLETFTHADAEPLQVPFAQVVSCISYLMQPDSWPFLKSRTQTDSLSQVRLDQWEEWFA